MFEELPIGVFTTDERGIVTLYNMASASMLSFDALAQTRPSVQKHLWLDWESYVQSINRGEPVLEREVEFAEKDGKPAAFSVSASKITSSGDESHGYLFIVRDLIEVKKLQKQVRLNERLTALGNLAAGVAHEMRNPLSSVKGYATFLAGKLKDTPAMGESARMMLIEVERLNLVVSDLLGMASPSALRIKPVMLRPMLERIVRLTAFLDLYCHDLTETEAEDKDVVVTYVPSQTDEEQLVDIDEDRVVQALLNLVVNAIQATDAGGSVQIVLHREPWDEQTGGESAIIKVTDTGGGMTPDVLTNIFTPYFTTKPSGTGLGLAIAHRIAEQHGGAITVRSKPGKGSVFNLHLPVSLETAKG